MDIVESIGELLQERNERDLALFFEQEASTQRGLENKSIRLTMQLVGAGATVINLLSTSDNSVPANAGGLFSPTSAMPMIAATIRWARRRGSVTQHWSPI